MSDKTGKRLTKLQRSPTIYEKKIHERQDSSKSKTSLNDSSTNVLKPSHHPMPPAVIERDDEDKNETDSLASSYFTVDNESIIDEDILFDKNTKSVVTYMNDLEKRLVTQLYSHVSELEAYVSGLSNIRKFLTEPDENECMPLYYAIKANCLNSIKLLIKYGANVRQTTRNGDPAQHVAALLGTNVEILDFLLQYTNSLYDTDQEGWTVFHCACNQAHLHIISHLLVKKFFNINFKDTKSQCTGLHLAAMNNHIKVVEYLLRFSVTRIEKNKCKLYSTELLDLNSQNNHGQSAMHLACRYGGYEVVRILLKSNGSNLININLQDFKGKTCLDWAWNWIINYEKINSQANEVLEIFYSNEFYSQKNGLFDSYEIDNQVKLIYLLAQYGAKFSSYKIILYDLNIFEMIKITSESSSLSQQQIDENVLRQVKRIVPILNYLKCLLFLYKLNICKLFLVNNDQISSPETQFKTSLQDNLKSLRNFVDEQVYNVYEKQIYYEKIEVALKMCSKL